MQQGEEHHALSNATEAEVKIIPSDGQYGTHYFRTPGHKACFQGLGIDSRILNPVRRQRIIGGRDYYLVCVLDRIVSIHECLACVVHPLLCPIMVTLSL